MSVLERENLNTSLQTLASVQEILTWMENLFTENKLFFGHGTDNAWDEAVAILLSVLKLPMDCDESILKNTISPPQKQQLIECILLRVNQRIPSAYLTHRANFAGLEFYVDEQVLIPRSPIAELIETRFHPWIAYENIHHILDIGTGSGCIALACAFYCMNASVVGVDISSQALAIAERNSQQLNLSERVTFIQSDLFQNLPSQKFDIIISNPPYVDQDDINSMPEEYHHEPRLGLAAGIDGLQFAIPIIQQAAHYLSDQGILIVEVGNSQYALEQYFPQLPFIWLEFERGGEGVFLLTRQDLIQAGFSA
ncbi:MAG: 50S ribosomal protein L3 N(5)-glutamine methyltransferase [Legionellales bacterium]|nr:50S ribosomal protein L3 N(5)-glutamine methyltransferase [Legionellales bacterium]